MASARPTVVLYNPRATFHTMPLGLLSIARMLDPARFTVRLVDGRLDEPGHQGLVDACRGASVLGITAITGAPLRDAIDAAAAVRAAHPALPVIWGGWHPSLFPAAPIEETAAAATIQGQGERPFLTVCERLVAGLPVDGVPGVTAIAEGHVRSQSAGPVEDVNLFPRMPYEHIPLERYFAAKRQRQLDYVSSQGCRFRCGFCADPTVFRRSWSGLAPERVVEELAWLERRHQITDVAFQDETFFTSAGRVRAMADGLLSRDTRFTWMATMRADQGARLPLDAYVACRRAGLRRVMVGLESGSQMMLDWMQKDAQLDQVFTLADRCRAAGVAVLCNLIVGFPGESAASVRETLRAATRLRAYGPQFQIAMFYFRPYPGTAITNGAIAAGFRAPETMADWAAVDAMPPPWADGALTRLIDRFVFYQRIGWAERSVLRAPLQRVARWRCRTDRYGWPIEQRVLTAVRRFAPQG